MSEPAAAVGATAHGLSFLRSSFLGHFCRSEFGYLPADPGTELLPSLILEPCGRRGLGGGCGVLQQNSGESIKGVCSNLILSVHTCCYRKISPSFLWFADFRALKGLEPPWESKLLHPPQDIKPTVKMSGFGWTGMHAGCKPSDAQMTKRLLINSNITLMSRTLHWGGCGR